MTKLTLIEALRLRKVSQRQLAREMNRQSNQINAWATGRHKMSCLSAHIVGAILRANPVFDLASKTWMFVPARKR